MRLSIDISPEQHQQLKDSSPLQGKSIQGYVLNSVLDSYEKNALQEQESLQELESFLKPRIEAAENGKISSKSIDDIFNEVEQEANTEK